MGRAVDPNSAFTMLRMRGANASIFLATVPNMPCQVSIRKIAGLTLSLRMAANLLKPRCGDSGVKREHRIPIAAALEMGHEALGEILDGPGCPGSGCPLTLRSLVYRH